LLKILIINTSMTKGLKEYLMASRIRNVKLSPIMVAVIAAMAAPCGFAQTSESKPEQEVVVSGSRIKRDNYSTSAPVQIIRNDDSVQAGFTSTAEVLLGTAVTGGQGQVSNQYAGYLVDGGPGVNTLGLRGLQPTRSLILLNGRRMSPSGTRGSVGSADLNTLPSAIVDRVEVLKDGSSSIYGSDAVAGVVNIITKKNLTGVTTSLNQTATAEGGGETTNFSLVGGFVGDKARFSGSYQYNERKAVTWADRDFTRCPIEYKRSAPDQPWASADFIDPVTGQPKCFSASSGFNISN
jgi:iron complex outermembrane recepter protein